MFTDVTLIYVLTFLFDSCHKLFKQFYNIRLYNNKNINITYATLIYTFLFDRCNKDPNFVTMYLEKINKCRWYLSVYLI